MKERRNSVSLFCRSIRGIRHSRRCPSNVVNSTCHVLVSHISSGFCTTVGKNQFVGLDAHPVAKLRDYKCKVRDSIKGSGRLRCDSGEIH